jgi:hypothetical protein
LENASVEKTKHVLSTTVQILDVLTSCNVTRYPVTMDRRKKLRINNTFSNIFYFVRITRYVLLLGARFVL